MTNYHLCALVLAVDRQSKLIISHYVGKRTSENAYVFLSDLKSRMANHFQLTTDNWQVYSGYDGAVRRVFGFEVDYATETKVFANPVPYLPRRVTAIRRKCRIGSPDMQLATTLPCRAHKPLCEAIQPPLYPLHARLFQEAGQSKTCRCAIHLAF